MRLTLRTLLAYLDDVLEPEQAREIGEKIAQSDFASTLSNRIKDVLRRRRITAPDLDGPGMGVDPNTVAEYLDNTLPPDAVADVERIFLESDVHLAEVAASHQILTLVLGEAVTISDESRERMYALGPERMYAPGSESQRDSDLVATMGGNGQSAASRGDKSKPARSDDGSFKDRLPAYLRRKPFWKRAIPYVLVLLLGGVFFAAIYGDPSFFGGGGETNGDKVVQNGDGKSPAVKPRRKTSPVKKPSKTIAIPPPPVKIAKAGPMKKGGLPDVPEGVNGKPPADVPDGSKAKPNKKPIVGTNPPVPVAVGKKKQGSAVAGKPVPKKGKTSTKVAGPTPKIEYRLPAGHGLLWRYDDASKDWIGLKHKDAIKPGDRLAAPSPFSSNIAIADGRFAVELRRGTLLEILPADKSALFGFDLKRGRFVIQPAGAKNDPKFTGLVFSLAIHGRKYRVELLTPETVCGVDVAADYPNAVGAKSDHPFYTASVVVAKGSARLTNSQGDVVVVNSTADTAGKASLTPPRVKDKDAKVKMVTDQITTNIWPTEQQTQSETELKFSAYYLKDLDADKMGRVSLLDNAPDIVRDRRAYVSQYAVESLGAIEDVAELVRALSIAGHEESRTAAIAGLRSWVAFHPSGGKALQAEMRKRFTQDDSAAITRLLWGFNQQDARDYATSEQLIRWLDHDHIAVRELAFLHVKRLTGFQYNYQPNLRADLRALAFKRWAAHLEKNEGLLPPDKKPAPIKKLPAKSAKPKPKP